MLNTNGKRCLLCGDEMSGSKRNDYCPMCSPKVIRASRTMKEMATITTTPKAIALYDCLQDMSFEGRIGVCHAIDTIKVGIEEIARSRGRSSGMGIASAAELLFVLMKEGYV